MNSNLAELNTRTCRHRYGIGSRSVPSTNSLVHDILQVTHRLCDTSFPSKFWAWHWNVVSVRKCKGDFQQPLVNVMSRLGQIRSNFYLEKCYHKIDTF